MQMVTTLPSDPRAQYRLHEMMLQHCQYARPARYWVPMASTGAGSRRSRPYPDACMIWITATRTGDRLADHVFGQINESSRASMARVCGRKRRRGEGELRANLDEPMIDDPASITSATRFVRDPVSVIRTFYEKYGIPFTAETQVAMAAYLATNRSDRYGKFVYSLDVIGEDVDALNREFAPYRERFGLEIEKRK